MNKKILMLTLMLLAMLTLAMLPVQVTPKEKLYFKLYMEGINIMGTEDRVWESDGVLHIRGQEFWVLEDFYIWIDEEGDVEIIGKEYLSYSASCDFNWNTKTPDGIGRIKETVTIWADTEHETLRGTIEISVADKVYNVYAPDMYGEGTFVGHGTDDFKGVKVAGTDSMTPMAFVGESVGEVIGTGNGTEVTFTATLTNPPVVNGSVSVTDGVETFSDNGYGILTGNLGGSGTIEYITGAISVTFNSAPDDETEITAGYNYIMMGGAITREGTVMGWPTT